MTFIDSNVSMYLSGAPHPHKAESQIWLERLAAARERLVTDAEVLQEILHRYAALRRPDAIGPVIRTTLELVDEVFPVRRSDVLRAAEIVQTPAALSARDAVHIAIMERRGIQSILTFDADFDRWSGVKRVNAVA